MICTRQNTADDQAPAWLGAPCPDCGHTSLGHPGMTNPTLDACLVCEVQAAVSQLRDTITGQALAESEQLAQLSRDQVALAERVARLEAPSMGEGA
jgi:hypothetical protein